MGHKILLADDSITIQKVVNLTFSDEGIDVVTVGNGEMAIRKLNDVKPDLVLADIYMPGKNGYEVCEYIKTHPQFSTMPVLLLVGAFEPFDQAEAARVKADGHLTKPFESRTLVATVNRLLAQIPPAPAPQASAPPPQPWQSGAVPPDATTTRLSPEAIVHFQFDQEASPSPPVKASPAPVDTFQPPVAPPVAPPPATLQFNFSAPSTTPVPSMPTTELSAEVLHTEAPPKFELDLNIPPEPPVPVAEPRPTPLPDFSAHFDAQEDVFEQTISIGVADLPEIRAQMPIPVDETSTTAQPTDPASPLELTEVESAHEEIPYEDMPLDLEPLEDITYQAEPDSVLEISEPVNAATVDAEPVLEKITTTEQEALVEPEVAPEQVETVAQQRKTTLEMVSLSDGESETAKQAPVFELPPEEPLPSESYNDLMPPQMAVDSVVEEHKQIPEPSQLQSAEPAAAAPTPFVFEMPAEHEMAASQESPVFEPEPPVIEEPEPEQPVPVFETPLMPEPPVPEPVEEAKSEPLASEPVYETRAEVVPTEPVASEQVYEAPTAPVYAQPVAQMTAPALDLQNLTIDQIPQQLIDEIVRRTIAQMSENVVREIAWEVVPDLAELLIKKRLDQNHR